MVPKNLKRTRLKIKNRALKGAFKVKLGERGLAYRLFPPLPKKGASVVALHKRSVMLFDVAPGLMLVALGMQVLIPLLLVAGITVFAVLKIRKVLRQKRSQEEKNSAFGDGRREE